MGNDYPAHDPRAACRDSDPDIFFPPSGAPGEVIRRAKAICYACEMVMPCGEWALSLDIRGGIYGGMTTAQRRAIIRRREKLVKERLKEQQKMEAEA